MTDPAPDERPQPRCPRCGAPLAKASLPTSVFGIEGDACVDCSEGAPTRLAPWACPACGGVYLLDPSATVR